MRTMFCAVIFSLLSAACAASDAGDAGLKTLGLKGPLKLVDHGCFRDGGTCYFSFNTGTNTPFEFCIDGRSGSATHGQVFINVKHPANTAGTPVKAGSAEEKALLAALKDWIDSTFDAAQLKELNGAEASDDPLKSAAKKVLGLLARK